MPAPSSQPTSHPLRLRPPPPAILDRSPSLDVMFEDDDGEDAAEEHQNGSDATTTRERSTASAASAAPAPSTPAPPPPAPAPPAAFTTFASTPRVSATAAAVEASHPLARSLIRSNDAMVGGSDQPPNHWLLPLQRCIGACQLCAAPAAKHATPASDSQPAATPSESNGAKASLAVTEESSWKVAEWSTRAEASRVPPIVSGPHCTWRRLAPHLRLSTLDPLGRNQSWRRQMSLLRRHQPRRHQPRRHQPRRRRRLRRK
jgi:hypothetical protein